MGNEETRTLGVPPFKTPQDLQTAIDAILEVRFKDANTSQYDWKILTAEVGKAALVFRNTPANGTVSEYYQTIVNRLEGVLDGPDWPDGEYISGRTYFRAILVDIQYLMIHQP